LLRRGWIASNVNASIRNAADFDIFALKSGRTVHLRVKTCGPRMNAFQFGFRAEQTIATGNFGASDFTVLVAMGDTREADEFYVIPTQVLRKTISDYREFYLAQQKRDGGRRKDTGHWTLNLRELRSGEDRPNYGLRKKWEQYRNNWSSLEA
jgi:hypothetical protein